MKKHTQKRGGWTKYNFKDNSKISQMGCIMQVLTCTRPS